MDILIFKGRQVYTHTAHAASRAAALHSTLFTATLFTFYIILQHLEEVRMQYKVKAQLQYFFKPPDHAHKASILGNEEVIDLRGWRA